MQCWEEPSLVFVRHASYAVTLDCIFITNLFGTKCLFYARRMIFISIINSKQLVIAIALLFFSTSFSRRNFIWLKSNN